MLTTLFAVNYISSGHEPVANNMPFGVVGSTSLAKAAQGDLFSLKITTYATRTQRPRRWIAARSMERCRGRLIHTLIVVPTISDISPLDISRNFELAAKQSGETITVKPYEPTPLAPEDPFALVPATLLIALLVGGYMAAALLTTAVGSASGRSRGPWLAGFAIVTALAVDLVTTYWLKGLPSSSFWIVWPILSLSSCPWRCSPR